MDSSAISHPTPAEPASRPRATGEPPAGDRELAPRHPRRAAESSSASFSKPWLAATLGLSLACWLLFGSLAVLRHRSLHSHAFDLGVYHQIAWTTSRGHFFETTYKSTIESGLRHHLGDHVELVLLAFAPLYWLYDGPETLLLVQAAVLAATGWVLALFAMQVGTGGPAAVLLQLLFYAHPSIQGPALFDFHPLVLAPLGLIAALLAAERERWRWFWIAVVGALLCREQVALSVAALALFVALRKRRPVLAAAVVAAAVLWLFVCLEWIIPSLHPRGEAQHFVAKFGHLGETPARAVAGMLGSPLETLEWLTDDGRRQYLEVIVQFSGALLFLLAPEVAVVAAPELALNLLSRDAAQRVYFWQYAATIATFLPAAAALGLGRVRRFFERRAGPGRMAWVPAVVVALALLFSLRGQQQAFGAPYLFAPPARAEYRDDGRTAAARRMFALIPETAALAAQSDLAPHLSGRRQIYVFPWMPEVEYILLDERGETFPISREEHAQRLAALRRDPAFELIAAEQGFLLFRRLARPSLGIGPHAGMPGERPGAPRGPW